MKRLLPLLCLSALFALPAAAQDDTAEAAATEPEAEASEAETDPTEAETDGAEADEATTEDREDGADEDRAEAVDAAIEPEPALSEIESVEPPLPPIEVEEPPPVEEYDGLDPCASFYRSRPVGPLQVGDLDGMLAVPHRACPREEVAIGGDFLLVADTAALYGNLRANGRGRVSAPILHPEVEAFVSWEAVRYQSILSAVSAEYVGLGYLSFGVSGQLFDQDNGVVALTSRFVAPTTTGLDQGSHPFALDLGVTAAYQVERTFRIHGWVMLLGSVGAGGPATPRGGVRLGGGFDWAMAEWISLVIEAVGGFGYTDAIDVVAGQLGFRLGFGDEVGLELAASLPFIAPRGLTTGALPIAASLMLNWYLP